MLIAQSQHNPKGHIRWSMEISSWSQFAPNRAQSFAALCDADQALQSNTHLQKVMSCRTCLCSPGPGSHQQALHRWTGCQTVTHGCLACRCRYGWCAPSLPQTASPEFLSVGWHGHCSRVKQRQVRKLWQQLGKSQ